MREGSSQLRKQVCKMRGGEEKRGRGEERGGGEERRGAINTWRSNWLD